jgi:sortase A
MNDQKLSFFQNICLLSGTVMLAAALVTLLFWQWNIHAAAKAAGEYARTLRTLIPEPQGAVPEQRQDNAMAVLSLNGTDFVGILEMPAFGSSLPVGADWGNTSRHPCRFSGSVYDGSIRIGATSQPGQYDFFREISVGDSLYFTDMTGNRYGYVVTDIRYTTHADMEGTPGRDADLLLFIRNVYAFEHILIYCSVPGQ